MRALYLAAIDWVAAFMTSPGFIMSSAEWNEIVAEQGSTGANGIGVSLAISLQ